MTHSKRDNDKALYEPTIRLLNLSLLKTHPAFRAVFIARFISILSLGLLGVAIPVQIQMMTHSTRQVGCR